jgi:predicted HAD superfamily Cof-like phosphohydrolase
MGADGEAAWNEVLRSNLSKIDPETGKVIKRESDGKVLKPSFYIGPELEAFVNPEFDRYSQEQRNLRPYVAENKDGGDF